MKCECGSLKRNNSVPPSLFFFFFFSFFYFFLFFWWPQWLFLFNSHFSSLGSFDFVLLGSFPHLGETLYILQEYRRSFTIYKGTQHKENITIMMQMYASARVAGYAMILARHVAMIRQGPTSMRLIDQASSMYDMNIKS